VISRSHLEHFLWPNYANLNARLKIGRGVSNYRDRLLGSVKGFLVVFFFIFVFCTSFVLSFLLKWQSELQDT